MSRRKFPFFSALSDKSPPRSGKLLVHSVQSPHRRQKTPPGRGCQSVCLEIKSANLGLAVSGRAEVLQEHGHHGPAVLHQGVIPSGQTPVVDQSPLAQGVHPDHLVDRHVSPELSPLLALADDLPQEPVIGAVVVQQGFVSPGDQLGGVQPGQQLQGDGVLDRKSVV